MNPFKTLRVSRPASIWHDPRRTFATELRARQVREYDIADLLGHNIQAVTGPTLAARRKLWKKP